MSSGAVQNRTRMEISLATVYRHLTSLHEAGAIHAVYGPEGEALYRRCGRAPHHHVRCRSCGRTDEIEASAEHHSLARAARNRSFRDIRFTIELDGICGACS